MIIATHNGEFHADEIFAIAILKKVYPSIKVIRTRDENKLKKADMRIDVGNKYNPKTGDFDHHQNSFYMKRENKIPYSSCGLIWKHFGKKIVNSKKAFDYIEENFIEFIDANDNGVDYEKGNVKVYALSDAIGSFNTHWKNQSEENILFKKALKFAEVILENEIEKANLIEEGERIVREELKKTKEEFVVLPYPKLPKEKIMSENRIKFCVFPGKGGEGWFSVAVKIKEGSFKSKVSFPEEWAGFTGKELEKISGVKGAKFCHKERFVIVAETKDAAIKMTKIALQKKKDSN